MAKYRIIRKTTSNALKLTSLFSFPDFSGSGDFNLEFPVPSVVAITLNAFYELAPRNSPRIEVIEVAIEPSP